MDIDLDSIAVYHLPLNPPWTLHLPTVNFKLHTGKKTSIDPDTFKLQFLDLLNTYPDYTCIYTDGSKEGDRVSSAAVSGQSVMKCRLPSSASIFSAELQAILLALDFIECSNLDKFLICSDSLSSLQAIHNHKFDNSVVQRVLEKCHFIYYK